MSVVNNGYKLWIVHLPKSQKHFGFNRVGKIVAGMFVQSIACCSPENGRISYRLSAPFLSYTGHVQDIWRNSRVENNMSSHNKVIRGAGMFSKTKSAAL